MLSPLRLMLVLGALASSAHAQTLVLIRNGQLSGGNFGTAIDRVGRVNGDNIHDFVVGADRTTPNLTFAGTGTVHSGADASVIYEVSGNTLFQYMGNAVAGLEDLNNDGFDDYVICAVNEDTNGSNSGAARIYSGQTGNLLYYKAGAQGGASFGSAVDTAGDVNNDGRPDFIVGATGDNGGKAFVYSGANGSLLHTFSSPVASGSHGAVVSRAGDVNNDGFDDVMVGTPGELTATTRGRLTVYSGQDGSVLHTFFGTLDDYGFPSTACGPGDLNGDGHADLVVGVKGALVNGISGGGVYVYSGLDGSLLYEIGADDGGDSMGEGLGDGGDVDQDGVGDFVVGVPRSGEVGIFNGHIRVISGATGTELFRVIGGFSNDRFGTACAIVDDISGSGRPDVLVGAPGAVQQRGRCYVYQYDDPVGTNYCTAAVNSTGQAATLAGYGSSDVSDNDVTLIASLMPANQFGYFLASMDQGLANPPGSSGNLCLGGQILRFSSQVQSTGFNGSFSLSPDLFSFPAPYNGPVIPGQTWNFQAWFRDVGSTSNFTDGLEVDFH